MVADEQKVIFSMVQVSRTHGQKTVLRDISLGFFFGAKIGVLGLNGAGKSTLLKIMAGIDEPSNGEVVRAPGYTVGLLEQEPDLEAGKTVREIVEEGAAEATSLLSEFDALAERFTEPMDDDEMQKVLDRQGVVQDKIESMGAWELDSRLELAAKPRSIFSRGAKGAELPFAGCSSGSPIFCFSTSPRTTSMICRWHGSNVTSRNTPAPSLPSPTIATSSIM